MITSALSATFGRRLPDPPLAATPAVPGFGCGEACCDHLGSARGGVPAVVPSGGHCLVGTPTSRNQPSRANPPPHLGGGGDPPTPALTLGAPGTSMIGSTSEGAGWPRDLTTTQM